MASTPVAELQEEFLTAVRKNQEIVLDATKYWVETIYSSTAKLPIMNVSLANWMGKPEDIVASTYDFAAQLLSSQRKFAEEMLKAISPMLPGDGNSAPE